MKKLNQDEQILVHNVKTQLISTMKKDSLISLILLIIYFLWYVIILKKISILFFIVFLISCYFVIQDYLLLDNLNKGFYKIQRVKIEEINSLKNKNEIKCVHYKIADDKNFPLRFLYSYVFKVDKKNSSFSKDDEIYILSFLFNNHNPKYFCKKI